MFSLDSRIISKDIDGGGVRIKILKHRKVSSSGGVSPFLHSPGAKATESEDTIFEYPERERERERDFQNFLIELLNTFIRIVISSSSLSLTFKERERDRRKT